MWARICEIILGLWLIASSFIFSPKTLLTPLFILLFATLSFSDKLNKMHLLQTLPAAYLLYLAYSYPTSDLPFGLQNYILIALSLLMFAVIPSQASDPPRPWQKFLRRSKE